MYLVTLSSPVLVYQTISPSAFAPSINFFCLSSGEGLSSAIQTSSAFLAGAPTLSPGETKNKQATTKSLLGSRGLPGGDVFFKKGRIIVGTPHPRKKGIVFSQ